MPERRSLNVTEAAHRLGVSHATVRRWVKSGRLAGHRVGSRWRVDPDAVDAARDAGDRQGASRPDPDASKNLSQDPVLTHWREYIENRIRRDPPEQVIVNDRRGAPAWNAVGPGRFHWGRDVWHSTFVDTLTPEELRQLFGETTVLLFDEVMQLGRDMGKLRKRLEAKEVGARVTSLARTQSRFHAESGELGECEADARDALPDLESNEWGALISEFIHWAARPLDVDHVVVEVDIRQATSSHDILQSMRKWGTGFPVWDEDHRLTGLTLDRPQFFNTAVTGWSEKGFAIDWRGPCKIRLYIGSPTGPNRCVFVAYPDIEARTALWRALLRKELGQDVAEPLDATEDGRRALRRCYRTVCMDLSIRLLKDFMSSGAADDLGLHFGEPDGAQLRSAYGSSRGDQFTDAIREVLKDTGKETSLPDISKRPPVILRKDCGIGDRDLSVCRRRLLEIIANRQPKGSPVETALPLSYRGLLESLASYAEPVVSQALDTELDIGTIQPQILCESSLAPDGGALVRMKRAYCQGELRSLI